MKDLEIVRFIRKELTREEEKAVLKWIEESEENRQRFNELKNLWAISPVAFDSNMPLAVAGLRSGRPDKSPGVRNRVLSCLKYAAIVVVTFGLSFYICYLKLGHDTVKDNSFYSVSAPLGQSTDIILADGSKVTLNSGTELTYPVSYSKKNRKMTLKGEAFFEVQSDKSSPFTVTASGIDIVATGTSFNIDAYSEDDQINVTLVEGSVNLYSSEGENLVKLNPGENAQINVRSQEMNISQIDTRFYTSWKEGMITFSNRRLEDIAKDLERWYNVEIVFMDDSCKDIRYSGTILKHKPVDQVLEILKLTSDFEFDIKVINNKMSRITIKK